MLETLLNDCKSLMRTFTNCTVAHVYGEANSYVDRLAKMKGNLIPNYLFLNDLELMVESLLANNKAKHFCNKLIIH